MCGTPLTLKFPSRSTLPTSGLGNPPNRIKRRPVWVCFLRIRRFSCCVTLLYGTFSCWSDRKTHYYRPATLKLPTTRLVKASHVRPSLRCPHTRYSTFNSISFVLVDNTLLTRNFPFSRRAALSQSTCLYSFPPQQDSYNIRKKTLGGVVCNLHA